MKKNGGFTLAEILVVMSLIAVAAVIVVQIFFRTLSGNNKVQTINNIKQNGQYVLELMDKNIREADAVVTICDFDNDGLDDSLLIAKSGSYTRYRFTQKTSTTNGQIAYDNPLLSPADLDTVEKVTDVCKNMPTTTSVLTDTNIATGVTVLPVQDQSSRDIAFVKKSFLRGFKDVVTINFRLKPAIDISAEINSQVDPIAFTTTIQLR